jgi:hypothetical protein
MNREIPEPNPPLSPEEESAAAKLTPQDLEIIDATVLSCIAARWQKLAMVVVCAKEKLESKYPEFSHTYYAMRVQALNDLGRLESQGNLDYMRFSEVRLLHESNCTRNAANLK